MINTITRSFLLTLILLKEKSPWLMKSETTFRDSWKYKLLFLRFSQVFVFSISQSKLIWTIRKIQLFSILCSSSEIFTIWKRNFVVSLGNFLLSYKLWFVSWKEKIERMQCRKIIKIALLIFFSSRISRKNFSNSIMRFS